MEFGLVSAVGETYAGDLRHGGDRKDSELSHVSVPNARRGEIEESEAG